MKLHYFKGPKYGNFGDELNAWLWPRLLPDFFDDDESVLFLGIGSIIGKQRIDNKDYKTGQKRIVFGSGFVSTYHEKPDLNDPDWDVFFVRGPETARTLGLPPEKSLGDAAILIRAVIDPEARKETNTIGFIPHWQSMDRGHWESVCDQAGLMLIDPRAPVETVLAQILACKFIVAEAMHGAIVADALRVPWIACLPIVKSHRNKWHDWADALNIKLEPHFLYPSSLEELRALIPYRILRAPFKLLAMSSLQKACDKGLTSCAAKRLRTIAAMQTSLSDDAVIDDITHKMLEQLALLKKTGGKSNSPPAKN